LLVHDVLSRGFVKPVGELLIFLNDYPEMQGRLTAWREIL